MFSLSACEATGFMSAEEALLCKQRVGMWRLALMSARASRNRAYRLLLECRKRHASYVRVDCGEHFLVRDVQGATQKFLDELF